MIEKNKLRKVRILSALLLKKGNNIAKINLFLFCYHGLNPVAMIFRPVGAG